MHRASERRRGAPAVLLEDGARRGEHSVVDAVAANVGPSCGAGGAVAETHRHLQAQVGNLVARAGTQRLV